LFSLVTTSVIDYLEKHVSEMTCYVSSGMLSSSHSLTRIVITPTSKRIPALSHLQSTTTEGPPTSRAVTRSHRPATSDVTRKTRSNDILIISSSGD